MTKTVVIEEVQTVTTENTQGDVEIVVVQPQANIVAVSLPETSVVEVSQPATATVIISSDDTNLVEVQHVIENTVVVEQPTPILVEVVSAGPQGPAGAVGPQGPQGVQGVQGPPGTGVDAVSIVGYPVQLASGNPDDLLSFTGSAWTNKPQVQVTDGGNF